MRPMNNIACVILVALVILCAFIILAYINHKKSVKDPLLRYIDSTIRDLHQIEYQYKRYLKLKDDNERDADMVINMAYSICKDVKIDNMWCLDLYLNNACGNNPRYIKNVRRNRRDWRHFFVDYYE